MNRVTALFLFIILTGISQISNAQLSQGNLLIGGSVGLSNTKQEYTSTSSINLSPSKSFSFNLNPEVSFLITDRLSLGFIVPLLYSNHKFSENDQKSRSTVYSFGPKVRYYFPMNRWAIFPEFQYTFGRQFSKFTSYSPVSGEVETNKRTSRTESLRAGLGAVYFINENVGIEGIFSYYRTEHNQDDDLAYNSEVSGIILNIGIQVYLHKKSE